jgi:hypothetical protein
MGLHGDNEITKKSLYCSQPCATFSPYIFTTKPNPRRAARQSRFRRLSLARAVRGKVGTTIAPVRLEKLFLEANTLARFH